MGLRDWFTSKQHRAATDLGNVLLTLGLVTLPQLEEAVRRQMDEDKRLGEILVSMGALSPENLRTALLTQRDMRRGQASAIMASVVERRWDVVQGALEAATGTRKG